MRFTTIASGSSGNCIYIGSDTTHILIDQGISAKRVIEGIEGLGIKPSEIDAIFVTHEHTDHTQGLGVFSRKFSVPIYATEGTIEGIKATKSLGTIDSDLFNVVKADKSFFVKDLNINPIRVSHDATEPVAYSVKCEKQKISVITDLGTYSDYTIECLKNSDIIMAEANHDIRMLQVGPYPYYLKQRILSDRGHLSNENCGRMISALLHDNLKHLFLGHLSKENNMPELAFETVRLEIEASDNQYHGNDFPLKVAKRDCPMAPVEI